MIYMPLLCHTNYNQLHEFLLLQKKAETCVQIALCIFGVTSVFLTIFKISTLVIIILPP